MTPDVGTGNGLPRLSYRDDQPYEVPFRVVDHEEDDDVLDGADYIVGIGLARDGEYWGTPKEWQAERAEIRRRDRARRNLGGFGFQRTE